MNRLGFSQDVQFELFGGQKFQIERLEKTCGGSIPGGSWEKVSFVGFSQDVQFELFGGQKFQIERLEKTCGGSIPGGSWEKSCKCMNDEC